MFCLFYVNVVRHHFCEVIKNATDLSQHEALKGAHVHETTLHVAFGARRCSIPLGILDRLLGHLDPKAAQGLRNGSAWRPFGPPTSPKAALRTLLRHARNYSQTSRRVSSVGGSAMHMKWPDGIGREAGIGRTQGGDELTVFRACP